MIQMEEQKTDIWADVYVRKKNGVKILGFEGMPKKEPIWRCSDTHREAGVKAACDILLRLHSRLLLFCVYRVY